MILSGGRLLLTGVGRRFDSFRHNTDVADLPGELERVRDGGSSLEREVRGPRNEPYLMRVLSYQGDGQAGGGAGGVVLTLVDLSALRRAERRFAIALEASGRAMALADAEGLIVLATRPAGALFGVSDPDALIGKPFAGLLDPADAARLSDADAPGDGAPRDGAPDEKAGAGASVPIEFPAVTAVRPDGSTFSASVSIARADGNDGRFLLATFLETTGRDALGKQLARKEHELRAVLENSRAAIFIKDLDGKYLLVNSHLCDLAGRTSEEMLGRTDADI